MAGIAQADHPVTEEERRGYGLIPTSLEALRSSAGLLPETGLTVPADKVKIIEAQLRTSYANVRPGHRVAGGVVLGTAGARLTFRIQKPTDPNGWIVFLETALKKLNPFHLKLNLTVTHRTDWVSLDLVLQSAVKDPHSGVTGGPFPVAEIQLARMIDRLIGMDGKISRLVHLAILVVRAETEWRNVAQSRHQFSHERDGAAAHRTGWHPAIIQRSYRQNPDRNPAGPGQ